MKPRYELIFIPSLEARKIVREGLNGWESVCDNRHGVAYWNSITGEFCWFNDDKGIAQLSKLA